MILYLCSIISAWLVCCHGNARSHPWIVKPNQLQGCYDFIVVGAGSAGCRVAEKLSAHQDIEVLILEAGKVPPDFTSIPLLTKLAFETDIVWRYRVEPMKNAFKGKPNQAQTLVGGRVLGGGSTINLMNYERGDRRDYDLWEKDFQATGWSSDTLFHYFMSDENNSDFSVSEKFHGRKGNLHVSSSYDTNILKGFFDAAEEKGYKVRDTGDGDTEGVYKMQASIDPHGRRSSSYTAFLEPHIGKRKNLHVATQAVAMKIMFAKTEMNETVAKGIEFIHEGRLRRICARKEIILSAGAIETPHLLMLSGIGPAEHLKALDVKVVADLPVGENLQNHVAVRGVNAIINETSFYEIPSTNDIRALLEWYKYGSGPFSSPFGTHLGVGFFRVNESDPVPDIEIMLQGVRQDTPCGNDVSSKEATFSMLAILMRPKSRGTVRLRSKDPFTPPVIDLNYFDDKDDIEILARGARFAQQLLNTHSFRSLGIYPDLKPIQECSHLEEFSLEYWKCAVAIDTISMGHPVGTCRMGGKDRKDTVVDPNLRVKGIKNLRVADCSVMPTLNTGHTNAPAIAIGARAGDLILMDYSFNSRSLTLS